MKKVVPAIMVAQLLMIGIVYAQQSQQPKHFQLSVTEQEINTISKGLGMLPYQEVVPLFNKLQQQIISQAEADKKKEPEAKK